MTREPIPQVTTSTEGMLAVIARRQDETNDLLSQILDRLPAADDRPEAGEPFMLREPRPKHQAKGMTPGKVTAVDRVPSARKRRAAKQ